MDAYAHTEIVKHHASLLGFVDVGIAKAVRLDKEAKELEQWLHAGHHGRMQYMENHFEKRVDPRRLVPGAKSVVTLTYPYYNPAKQEDDRAPKVAMYAYGRDYHKVIKKKLKKLLAALRERIGDIQGRCFVDSAPVMERAWAARSGVGWQGKNTLTLTKGKGSYAFLAVLIIDLELLPDGPVKDYCGTCTKCIDACPTDAIYEPYKLDASKCISYLTIELKDKIPEEFKGKMGGYMFGCDICQEVCPINARAKKHSEVQFEPKEALLQMKASEWGNLTEWMFDELFLGSPVKRAGFTKLKQNIAFLKPSADS